MKEFFSKCFKKGADAMLKYSPPWLIKFKTNYPKCFWAFVIFLVILPFGVTAFIGIQGLVSMLAWAARVRLW